MISTRREVRVFRSENHIEGTLLVVARLTSYDQTFRGGNYEKQVKSYVPYCFSGHNIRGADYQPE